MARITLIFAFLMVVLGEAGYLDGQLHKTALIPVWFGVALGLFGFLAIRAKTEKGRMTLMAHQREHRAAGISGGAARRFAAMFLATAHGHSPDMIALASKVTMAVLMGIYVALCVQSFIAVRRARQA